MEKKTIWKRCMAWMTAGILAVSMAGCGRESMSAGQTKNQAQDQREDSQFSQLSGQSQMEGADDELVESLVLAEEMFTERDLSGTFDEKSAVEIRLAQDNILCGSDGVEIQGSNVIIRKEGVYRLSGQLENGMILVEAANTAKIQLVLAGVEITNDTGAAIYIIEADKVFLTLAEGTENALVNGGSYVQIDEHNVDAAVFSRSDLTINGAGALTVTARAGHGIVSKDDLKVTGGSIAVTAEKKGLSGKDSVRIGGGSLDITSGGDGICAENSEDTEKGYVYVAEGELQIEAGGDGISAGAFLQIDGGDFRISAGGGSGADSLAKQSEEAASTKGIKASGELLIGGGSFDIDSLDDALHSNSGLTVNGGDFQIATGDDGLHSDGRAWVTDGKIEITSSYEGIEGKSVVISGGNIRLRSSDDGLNAAGGRDGSGFAGRDGFAGIPEGREGFGDIPGGGEGFGNRPGDRGDFEGGAGARGGFGGWPEGGEGFEAGPGGGEDFEGAPGGEEDFEGHSEGGGNFEAGPGAGEGFGGRPGGGEGFGGDPGAGGGFGGRPEGGEDVEGGSGAGGGFAGRPEGGNGFAGDLDCFILISGGVIYIDADGDGIDSNGSLTVSGGEIYISGPENGANGAIDYESAAQITGGILVAAGSSQMAVNFGENSEQGSVLIKTAARHPAGTKAELKNARGEVLLSITVEKAFDSIVFSCPSLEPGGQYMITVGEEEHEVTLDTYIYGSGFGGFGGRR